MDYKSFIKNMIHEKTGEEKIFMRNLQMLIQYDGTRYQGWQSQKHTAQTIQGKLTHVLGKMTGESIELQGAGRTDAGVHARGQTANFHTETSLSCEEILSYVNQYLPEDIAVLKVEEAGPRFHSRLSAVGKTYVYRIWNSPLPNVFERRYMYQVREPLDKDAMEHAAGLLCGTHDFRAFCSNRRMKKSAVRRLDRIEFEEKGCELCLHFTGNGFLYHMVRILTGTLLETGLGKRRPEEMGQILESLDRERAGVTAPAQGLCLWQVEYPENADCKTHR